MNRRRLLDFSVTAWVMTLLAGGSDPATGRSGYRALNDPSGRPGPPRARFLPLPTPPEPRVLIRGERLGRLAACSFAIIRDSPVSREGLVQGTLVVTDMDWELLERSQARRGAQSVPLSMRFELPQNSEPIAPRRTQRRPTHVELEAVKLHREGFGWAEDDLTHEVTFTFSGLWTELGLGPAPG